MKGPENKSISTLGQLAKRAPIIAIFMLVGFAGSFTYWALKPNRYEARATLLLPFQEGGESPISFLMNQSDPLSVLRGILISRTALQKVSQETGYPYTKLEDTLKILPRSEENQMILSIEVADKDQGVKIIQSAIDTLKELSKLNAVSVASRQAKLLKSSIERREKELQLAEEKMTKFSKEAKTSPDPENPLNSATYARRLRENELQLSTATKRLELARADAKRRALPSATLPTGIPEVETWRGKVADAEFELRTAAVQFGDKSPTVVRLQGKVEASKKALRETVQSYIQAADENISPELAKLESDKLILEWENKALKEINEAAPTESATFSRLYRDVQSLDASLKQLNEQYDMAITKAEVERVRWSLLVPPYAENEPVNKSKITHGVYGLMGGLGLSILYFAFVFSRKAKG